MKKIAAFGVAGNFTGHLEQAGEDKDFLTIKTDDVNAPKALFPTYIPCKKTETVPLFLTVFPFNHKKIIFPENEQKIQIEPECAVIFDVKWSNGDEKKVVSLNPVCFTASNDCSIRKEGAKKISFKKNWGHNTKGCSNNFIPLKSFNNSDCILNDYSIASFLIRDGQIYEYGQNSLVKNYSYIYEKLNLWLIDKLNNQKDEGPAEKISDYLKECNYPERLFISIGATKYTDFGEKNFLKPKDKAIVAIYPHTKYSEQLIKDAVKNKTYGKDCSILIQTIYS